VICQVGERRDEAFDTLVPILFEQQGSYD
jgi:hypothetical protein